MGKASFYSKRATGSRTSSGERLHHDSLTCAHRTYPFGTLLKVRNVANDSEVIVRVTDRGPFSRNRIIDLSWSAAKAIGMLSHGVATVEVTYVGNGDIPYRPNERIELPEFDFEVSNAGYSFIDSWKDVSDQTDENYPSKEKKATTTVKPKPKKIKKVKHVVGASTVSGKQGTTKSQNEDNSNKWSNVFEKIKNWGGNLF